ncbi:MAG: SH3 domain-containing protein [Lentisphaerales bacterium]|nr:SH3 domain-containing protein [Lentisphaerales bacterium]
MSETKSIKLKTTKMRKSPSYLGEVVKTLKYADKVKVIRSKGDWSQIEISGIKGWVNSSAISDKLIVLKSGKNDANKSVSDDEMLLASKGFGKGVEEQYSNKSGTGKNFNEIDRIESIEISPTRLKTFIKEGGLKA